MSAPENRSLQMAGSSRGLFPAYLSLDKNAPPSLFPAYTNDIEKTDGETSGRLDWLENKSFGKNTADILVQLQKEGEQLKPQERSLDISCPDEELSDHSTGSKSDLKRKRETDEERISKTKRKKHKKKHKKRHHGDEEEKKSANSEKTQFYEPEKGKIFMEEVPGLTPAVAFRVDRSADQNNWTYGSLYKLHIGKYHRLGHSCLGLSSESDAAWWTGPKKSKKKMLPSEKRYYAKENVLNLRKSASTFVNLGIVGTQKDTVNSDFLPVENIEEQELFKVLDNSGQVNPLGIYDSSTCSYLQGKSSEETPKTSTEENTCAGKAIETSTKTAQYNKKLRENPNDVKLWLEFVKFQDKNTALNAGSSEGTETDKILSNSTKVTEKKLAILQKAIQANPASVELKVSQLELSCEILEPPEIAKEWKQLLFVHPGKTTLWLHYALFVQSNLTQFTVSKTVKCYHNCMSKLTSVMSGGVHLVDTDKPQDEDLLIIFFQYCSFLKQSGHTEKAIASLQALVEFNMFSPGLVEGVVHSEKLTLFESFWDSSVARFGESGAKGWAAWVEKKESLEDLPEGQGENEEEEETILGREQELWKTWLEMESHREAIHWLPWRPDLNQNQTDEDCEDPDRLVLVDDVTPVLFTLHKQGLNFDLILMFLRFCGVPVKCYYRNKIWEYVDKVQLFFDKIDDAGNFQSSKIDICNSKPQFAESQANFVRNVVRQSTEFFSVAERSKLLLLLLDFEFQLVENLSGDKMDKSKSKELRKLAKALLKEEQNRNNLLLWNWYAKLEYVLGKGKDCLGILETALSMQTGFVLSESASTLQHALGLCTLYATYCRVQLGFPATLKFTMSKRSKLPLETVTNVILSIDFFADGKGFKKTDIDSNKTSPTMTLKTKKKLQDMKRTVMEMLNSTAEVNELTYEVEELCDVLMFCGGLYEYCTSNIDSVGLYYRAQVEECDKNMSLVTTNHWEVWQKLKHSIYTQWLELIIFHQTTSFCPLSKLQKVLDMALTDFPDDKQFLQLFVDVETLSFITGRLRRYFDRSIKSSSAPTPAVFCCVAEIERHVALITERMGFEDSSVRGDTGVVHRVRSVLERALQAPHCQNCILLWRMYMHFEMKYGDPSRTKGIFYRALQKCPWSKILYMDAVSLFPEQLQELVDLMLEKEIRVQIPVEEIHILRGTEDMKAEPPVAAGELFTQLVSNIHDGD